MRVNNLLDALSSSFSPPSFLALALKSYFYGCILEMSIVTVFDETIAAAQVLCCNKATSPALFPFVHIDSRPLLKLLCVCVCQEAPLLFY